MLREFWNYADELVKLKVATYDEIALVCTINGCSMEILRVILYIRTGYHDFEQFEKEMNEVYYEK